MVGFRQGIDSSKTVPANTTPSSSNAPLPEPIRRQVKLTKAQVRFRLIDVDPSKRKEKVQAINALLSIKEERKDLMQECIPTVCLSFKLECSGGANAGQDMTGKLLSVLVHASNLGCDLSQAYDLLQELLENGTVAQKHSVAMVISNIEESEADISQFIRPLVKGLDRGSCDQTARMLIAKTLINCATRSQQNARTILDDAMFLDPRDSFVAKVVAGCESVLGVSDRPARPITYSQPVSRPSNPKALFFDAVVNASVRPVDPTEEVMEGKPVDEIPIEDVVRLLWESSDLMLRKRAVDILILHVESADEAREVLSMLPPENPQDPNSFVNGIRTMCCRKLREGMPVSSDPQDKKVK